MLADGVLCDLPDGDLLIALLLDIPANFDNFRVDADAGDRHACDGGAFRHLSAVGHRADNLAFGCDPGASVKHRGRKWCRLVFGWRGNGYRRRNVGIAAGGIAIKISLNVNTADIEQQHHADQHKQIAERPEYAHAPAQLGSSRLGGGSAACSADQLCQPRASLIWQISVHECVTIFTDKDKMLLGCTLTTYFIVMCVVFSPGQAKKRHT